MAGAIVPRRPVTNLDRVNGLDTVIDAVVPVFQDLGDRVADYPGFIRSDEPRSPLGAAVRGIARANCRLWAASDKSGFSTRVNTGNAELCGPYLEDIGERPDDGEIGRDFEGGQCLVAYRLFYSWQTVFTDGTISEERLDETFAAGGNVIGPIRSFDWQNVPGNSFIKFSFGTPAQEVFLRQSSAPQGAFANARLDRLERLDGLPDDCGSIEPFIRPPATVTPTTPQPPDITVNLPGLGPVEVNITLGPTGDPTICIPILGVCEDVEINPPAGGGDGGNGGGGSPPPGDVGTPGGGATAGPGGDAEGEAPPGSEIVGLRLNLASIPEGARTFAPGVYRGPAYIYMGTPTGLDQDYAGSMLAETQFVFAEREGLTNWRVKANDEYVINVVPYYREVV